jgi:hypothetical protein
MDFITIIIILAVLFSIVGGIIWYVFIFLVGRAIVKGIARSLNEFQGMDIDGMYRTLLHLQQTGQIQLGQQYMGSLDGPVTSEIRGMAASEGISLDF